MIIKIYAFILVLLSITHGEMRINTTIGAETAMQYDGNILYPDSITNKTSFVSFLTLRPSLLLQLGKMTMLKISASGAFNEQWAVDDYSFASVLNIQFKHFISHKTMIAATADGGIDISSNALLEERRLSLEAQAGRYLTPFVNLSGKISGALRQYPGLFKIDSIKKSFFYDHVELKPVLLLVTEHASSISSKIEISGILRSYYDDNQAYDYVDSVLVVNHTFLADDGSIDTVYDTVGIPSTNIDYQRDYGIKLSFSGEWKALNWLSVNLALNSTIQESNDPYYISREIEPVFSADVRKGSTIATFTFAYGFAYFPERGDDYTEQTPFAGLIIRKRISNSFSAELSGAYRRVTTSNDNFDYDKPMAMIKLLWKK